MIDIIIERDVVEAWLAAAIRRRGGLCAIPEHDRWQLYEAAKQKLGWCDDYERRIRILAEMLDL